MTEGAIWKEILFFSIPLILGNLFQQLYNTVDSIIVGNWIGSEALAAVGSSGAIINLLLGFCIGASAGAGVVVSQFFVEFCILFPVYLKVYNSFHKYNGNRWKDKGFVV